MRLGGRLAAAIEVLEDMERRRRPAADALKDWGLSHRFAGSADRSAIGNIVYDALRRKRSAGWITGQDTPRGQAFGAVLLEWGQTPDALNAALQGDKFAPPALDERELTTIAQRNLDSAPDAVRADCPDWCVPLLGAAYGADWVEEAAAMATRPPLDLRVNTLLSTRDKVLAELADLHATPAALAPHGIRIPPIDGSGRHPNVQAEPAFQKGWFEVQDEGSQIVAHLAGAKPGMRVLDFCAGAGGKTLELAAAMENAGQIFAHDADKARLAPIFDRLRRAEAKNVEVVAKRAELEPLVGSMGLVLVDAPCTGSGTWRRRPDAKWRLSAKQLAARQAEQAAILDDASRFVKPDGRLVYVTCSVFGDENEGQIDGFCSRNSDFKVVEPATVWSSAFEAPAAAVRLDRNGISLSPARTGTDGFFSAVLARNP
ncbi:MAG: RsmB/NOP family class I SAM-dependent RNA methyltransferase [Rhizobiaceae bacterium]